MYYNIHLDSPVVVVVGLVAVLLTEKYKYERTKKLFTKGDNGADQVRSISRNNLNRFWNNEEMYHNFTFVSIYYGAINTEVTMRHMYRLWLCWVPVSWNSDDNLICFTVQVLYFVLYTTGRLLLYIFLDQELIPYRYLPWCSSYSSSCCRGDIFKKA